MDFPFLSATTFKLKFWHFFYRDNYLKSVFLNKFRSTTRIQFCILVGISHSISKDFYSNPLKNLTFPAFIYTLMCLVKIPSFHPSFTSFTSRTFPYIAGESTPMPISTSPVHFTSNASSCFTHSLSVGKISAVASASPALHLEKLPPPNSKALPQMRHCESYYLPAYQ